MDNLGVQPSARILAVSRKMNGLSPIHPRSPPEYSRAGDRPRCPVIHLMESFSSQVLVGAEVEDVDLVGGALERDEDGIDAVLHVEI